ncbi:MAG: NAD(P)-dependent oxidoreductase [bacterium]
MNLLVLGATGNTGRQFVSMALERGHKIRAIVRKSADLEERNGLEVIQGDVLNPVLLRKAVSGMDAVVSCLGIRKENPSDPWSALLSPEDLMARSTAGIVDAMQISGIKRLLVISSAGIGDSWEAVDPDIRTVIQTSSISKVFLDLNNMEEILDSSGLDTLAVRPVALINGEASGRAQIVSRFEKTSKITTGDVARWMLDAVERPALFKQRSEMIGSST